MRPFITVAVLSRAVGAMPLVLAVVLAPAGLLSAAAQPEGFGSLAGAVRAPGGAPLPQLVLTLAGPSGARTLVTGPEGRYRATGLTPGEYRLTAEAPGFLLQPEALVTVGAGETSLDLTLAPAPVREQVVVSATRAEAALSTLGVSVSVLDHRRIAEREAATTTDLLADVPGLAVARAGGVGLQASAFVRGGEARYARILVDGVPMNQPGGAFDLGSALPVELERVEVVRGAASSLYGTDALAGVVQLVTRQAGPGERPGLHAEGEGGSLAWRRLQGGSSGRAGGFDWNAGLVRLETDNEQPNSAFRETAGAASLGARFGERSALRFLLRAEGSTVGTPGPTAFARPDLDASFARTDWTLGGEWRLARDRSAHEVRIGFASTRQLSLDPLDSGSYVPRAGDRVGSFAISDLPDPSGFQNDSRRLSVGYQVDLQAGRGHLLTVGAELERETGDLGRRGGGILAPARTNFGAYLQDRLVVGARLYLTLGGRVERNDSYGTRFVPRVAAALRLRAGEDATTLRASAGAGIKEPDFLQSFGRSFFALGNPDLRPERSRTFDLGLEQRLLDSRLRVEATLFHHDYLDQIAFAVLDFDTFQGTYVNLGKTRARGLELSLEAAPDPRLRLCAEYTLLDGEVLVSASDFDPVYAVGRSLLRRPRHQASLTAGVGGERVSIGATLRLVGRRADSDFLGLGLTENPGYARLDARVRARLARGLGVFVVGENLLDRRYQEALGYPALGRTVRAGVRYRTGER